MPTAWPGADPVQLADLNDYELGEECLANVDITISHIRVWSGAGEVTIASRRAHVWSSAGSLLGTATLADDLPTGWSQYALDTPVQRPSGQRFVVSYTTGGNYGGIVDALAGANIVSADGAVTFLGTANATNGNGVFNTTPNTFPTTSPGSHPFYGVDLVYSLGLGGNTAPVITSVVVTAVGAQATSVITATDAETLVGATYRVNWGDGSAVSVGASNTATHTYTTTGLYPVLVSVTDAGGLITYAAAAVFVTVPSTNRLASAIVDAINALGLGIGCYVDAPPPNRATPYVTVFDKLDVAPAHHGDEGSSTQDEAVYELCQVDYVAKRRTPDNGTEEDQSIVDRLTLGLNGNRLITAPYHVFGVTIAGVLRLPAGDGANLVVNSITLRVARGLRRTA